LTVELVGLPGSGKTTLVRGAVRELERLGVPAHETFARWNRGRWTRLLDHATTLAALLGGDRRVLVAGALAARARPAGARVPLNLLANWANRCGHLRMARHAGGVHVMDQGAFQAYWSMAFAAGRKGLEAVLPRLEAARPAVDAVVVVHASGATVARRLAVRPGRTSRLERASAGGGGPKLERAELEMDHLCRYLRSLGSRGGLVVLDVVNDADDGGALAAKGLAAAVAELYEGATQPPQ
jgi:hypothetical protein